MIIDVLLFYILIVLTIVLGILFYLLKYDDPILWWVLKDNEDFKKLWTFPEKFQPDKNKSLIKLFKKKK